MSGTNPKHEIADKSLIVGAPRTGFALLLNILGELGRPPYDVDKRAQRSVNLLMPLLGDYLYLNIIDQLKKAYPVDEIIVNQTFRPLLGGPFWLDDVNQSQACVRKYIGVKDRGDFTLLIYLPKNSLHYHDRIHSHYYPSRWLKEPSFSDCTRFASMRNPLGALYSAAFSINAITGEYIDRFIGDEGDLRESFARFRLSDMKMVAGLVAHTRAYLEEFSAVKDQYHLFRWEDMIQQPLATIRAIAEHRGQSLTEHEAQAIWDKISYKNLTGRHRYNFRRDKHTGRVDDWKYHLCNEHLELMSDQGMDHYLREFSYAPIEYFREKDYTPFQRQLSQAIRKGQVITEGLEDKNLQIFNWNKSNIVKTDHDFTRYPRKAFSCIERAHFTDEAVIDAFSEGIETVMETINEFISKIYQVDDEQSVDHWRASMNDIRNEYFPVFSAMNNSGLMSLYDHRFNTLFDVLGAEQ